MDYTLEEKYARIREDALAAIGCDPVHIAHEIMRRDYINMHGPEHHFLDGAAFLAAYRNAGGEIDLDKALDELAKRTVKMPGAMCGQWGVCGSAASVGAALSVILALFCAVGFFAAVYVVNLPQSAAVDFFYRATFFSAVIAKRGEIGGARCCKRNAYLSLSMGAAFVREKYSIPMETAPIACDDSARNGQCIGERCPFHPKGDLDI